MAENLWPRHRPLTAPRPLLLLKALFGWRRLGTVGAVLGLALLYVAGVNARLPMISAPPEPATPWWFLRLTDDLFTGGALGHGALFALGLAAPIRLGRLTEGLLLRLAYVTVLALLACGFYVSRQRLDLELVPLLSCLGLLVVGGGSLSLMEGWLARLKGPHLIHINILVLLAGHFVKLYREPASSGLGTDVWVAAVGTLALGLSAWLLLRSRIFFDVENFKSPAERRRMTLEIRGVDEVSLDLLGVVSVVLFVLTAGVMSMVAGWPEITQQNYYWFGAAAAAIVLFLWCLLLVVRRLLSSRRSLFRYLRALLDVGQLPALWTPYRYASRMLNNFWVIPGVKPGEGTERFIETKLRTVVLRSFTMYTVWFVVVLGIQLYALRHGSGVLLFPYGPLVFIAIFLMCVGYASMLGRQLRLQYGHQKMLARGMDRVMEQSYALHSPRKLDFLDLESKDRVYWKEGDQLGDQLKDIRDWLRLLQRAQVPRPVAQPRRAPIGLWSVVARVLLSLLSGVAIAFVAGLLYVLFEDDPEDLWAVVVPMFVGGFLGPNFLVQLFRSRARSGPDSEPLP